MTFANSVLILLTNSVNLSSGFESSFEVSEDIPEAIIDRRQTSIVFWNLIRIAHDAMPSGGVIRIVVEANATYIRASVIDHGIGIPDVLLNQLFDMSKTTSRAGTQGESGTGFGMPLVKKFVEGYGGTLQIDSKDINEFPDNHGTTVKIILKAS